MSKYWKNSDEVTQAFVSMLEKCFENPELKEVAEKFGKTVLFKYSDPDAQMWVISQDGKIELGKGEPPVEPDIELSLSSDDGHKAWSNKMNLVMAVGRKKIKVKGNPAQLLKLAPMLKKSTPYYHEVLREMGKESIIL